MARKLPWIADGTHSLSTNHLYDAKFNDGDDCKMPEWKMRYRQNCRGRKCRSSLIPVDSQPETKLRQLSIKHKFTDRRISHMNNSLTSFAVLVFFNWT